MIYEPVCRTREDETALVRRAQAGSRAAFDALVDRYRGLVLAMAFLRTSDRDDAEDLAQGVLAKAWDRLPGLHDPAAFRGWLTVITANACRDWVRRRAVVPLVTEADSGITLVDPGRSPLEEMLAREARRAWKRALEALPAGNRLPLVLHVWGRYSYEEIADLLGAPLTTIEGRIYRARQQLRRLLPPEEE